jgi:hypothetical protein
VPAGLFHVAEFAVVELPVHSSLITIHHVAPITSCSFIKFESQVDDWGFAGAETGDNPLFRSIEVSLATHAGDFAKGTFAA